MPLATHDRAIRLSRAANLWRAVNSLFLLFRLNPVHDYRALERPLAPQGIAEMAEQHASDRPHQIADGEPPKRLDEAGEWISRRGRSA
jgi:hypothetical protein